MWKHSLKGYFTFTAKERSGVILIVSIIVLVIFLPLFYPLLIKQRTYSYSEFEKEISLLTIEKKDSSKTRTYAKNYDNELNDDYSVSSSKKYEAIKAENFYFDPNTASADEWRRLGLRDKTIHTIQNYLSKGGKFYKPEDISKIWGLSPADAQRLTPYVRLKNIAKATTVFEKKEYPKAPSSYPAKTIQLIDVNLADTTAFINLPGIGSKLSQRIIAFRTKLGGFYSVEQVGETYLLPDSTFQKIKPKLVVNNSNVKKININTATVDEMKIHPYLRYNLANAIYQYRQQHGNFNAIEDVKKIVLITEDVFNKVAPYLTIK